MTIYNADVSLSILIAVPSEDPEVIRQVAYEEYRKRLADPEYINFFEIEIGNVEPDENGGTEISCPALEGNTYMCVTSAGGHISGISEHCHLVPALAWVRTYVLNNGFDPESDDIRIIRRAKGQSSADLGQEEVISSEDLETWADERSEMLAK